MIVRIFDANHFFQFFPITNFFQVSLGPLRRFRVNFQFFGGFYCWNRYIFEIPTCFFVFKTLKPSYNTLVSIQEILVSTSENYIYAKNWDFDVTNKFISPYYTTLAIENQHFINRIWENIVFLSLRFQKHGLGCQKLGFLKKFLQEKRYRAKLEPIDKLKQQSCHF